MSTRAQSVGTARDFDFWLGSWKVHNRRLRERLAGSDGWDEFEATVVARPLLDGMGNEDGEQAFSDDGGETWETNWVMDFTPAGAGR